MGRETHATRATIRVVACRALPKDVTKRSLARAQLCSSLNIVVHGLAWKNSVAVGLQADGEGGEGGSGGVGRLKRSQRDCACGWRGMRSPPRPVRWRDAKKRAPAVTIRGH